MKPTRTGLVRVALVVAALVAAVAPTPPDLVERLYSRGLYPGLQRMMTPLSNLWGWALFDLLCAGAVSCLGLLVVRRLRGRHTTGWLRAGAGLAGDVALVVAVVYLLFLAAWGLNYRRQPLRLTLDFDASRVTPDAVADLADRAVTALNGLRPDATARPWPALSDLPVEMARAFAAAQEDLALPGGAAPGRPKRSILSGYFVRAAIDGMTDPFAHEVLINPDVLPFERPFVLAHEWGHLAGFAVESEASFFAWLTCQRGGAQLRYSGWLALFLHVTGALPPGTARETLARLDEGPRGDVRAVVARYRRAAPVVRETARRTYDRFLRANRVASGVASYDEVVTLIAGTRFDDGGRPVLRAARVPPRPPGR